MNIGLQTMKLVMKSLIISNYCHSFRLQIKSQCLHLDNSVEFNRFFYKYSHVISIALNKYIITGEDFNISKFEKSLKSIFNAFQLTSQIQE